MNIGVIGGSGLYELEGLEALETCRVETPFGAPSDAFLSGMLHGRRVYFLPRHGRGHRLLPSEINHRANIYGFKLLGVERVISISAVGSLREDLRPRDVLLPDQYFDRTKQSEAHTFFGGGIVAHVGFAHPTCDPLRASLAQAARKVIGRHPDWGDVRVHDAGTYVNMEGPAFSTRAESLYYRRQGFDVIGMTSLAEAKLCREAELCYQSVAMITDYDAWHESESPVTVDMIVGHLQANTRLAKAILGEVIPALPATRDCPCGTALTHAIMTDPAAIPELARRNLAAILGNRAR